MYTTYVTLDSITSNIETFMNSLRDALLDEEMPEANQSGKPDNTDNTRKPKPKPKKEKTWREKAQDVTR